MLNKIFLGDCLKGMAEMPENSVDCVITSPPYFGLRDYGDAGQLGNEKTVADYVAKLVLVFAQVNRILKPEGTVWLNLGDCYSGSGKGGQSGKMKSKNYNPDYPTHHSVSAGELRKKQLIGIPWRVAFALQDAGWYLRQDIIWAKPNPMPESVKDRCTRSHEYLFMLTKSPNYYYDAAAIRENAVSKSASGNGFKRESRESFKNYDGFNRGDIRPWQPTEYRNKRSVWTVGTKPYKGAHFATYPIKLITPCILAGCPVGGLVADPFMGSGRTAIAALMLRRNFTGWEINPAYKEMAEKDIAHFLCQPFLDL